MNVSSVKAIKVYEKKEERKKYSEYRDVKETAIRIGRAWLILKLSYHHVT